MPHMHLPLQSGSDRVLRRMARRCKTAQFGELVERARSEVHGFNVTTDIIVGFPGESESEWQETMRFVEDVGFGHIHVFPYSPRHGTKAATMPGQVDKAVKKDRSSQLRELAGTLATDAMKERLGENCEVLWEHRTEGEGNEWVGYTPHYYRVKTASPANLEAQISKVQIIGFDPHTQLLAADAL